MIPKRKRNSDVAELSPWQKIRRKRFCLGTDPPLRSANRHPLKAKGASAVRLIASKGSITDQA